MLPKNTLGRQTLRKLKGYAGPDHPHQAQRPEPYEIPQIARGRSRQCPKIGINIYRTCPKILKIPPTSTPRPSDEKRG